MSVTESKPQHLVALEKGNQIRYARAEFKRQVRELERGEALFAIGELFDDPPEWAMTWPVEKPILAVKNTKRKMMDKALEAANLQASKRIENCTRRQLDILADFYREAGEPA